VLLDQSIDIASAVHGHAKKIVGKSAHVVARSSMLGPKRAPNLVRTLLAHVRLKQHLQSHLARFTSGTHNRSQ
jgi:hypothetical protein